jgi:hypothetical protein
MPEFTKLKIFIASSNELKTERDKSILIVNELNKIHQHLFLEAVEYEYDLPSGNFPDHATIQKAINPLLLECQIAVFIFYSKIGGFTKEEFELVSGEKMKFFTYFRTGYSPVYETVDAYKELLIFKREIKDVLYTDYESLAEFDMNLYKNLNLYLSQTYPSQHQQDIPVSSSKQYIPLAPRPYFAHPYSLPKNFTGRTEEMNELTKWFLLYDEPVYVVEAIGGMGKSAMAWTWLQNLFIRKEVQTDGIVWWSFYDQGFEDFVKHLLQYCIPEGERRKLGVIDEAEVVANFLANNKFLIILDGFERVLRGYAQMTSMYIQEEGLSKEKLEELEKKWDHLQRSSMNPKADRLIKKLCAGQSKK